MVYLLNQFSQKVRYEVEPDEYLDQRLRDLAERLKKRLTSSTKASGILEGDGRQEKLVNCNSKCHFFMKYKVTFTIAIYLIKVVKKKYLTIF